MNLFNNIDFLLDPANITHAVKRSSRGAGGGRGQPAGHSGPAPPTPAHAGLSSARGGPPPFTWQTRCTQGLVWSFYSQASGCLFSQTDIPMSMVGFNEQMNGCMSLFLQPSLGLVRGRLPASPQDMGRGAWAAGGPAKTAMGRFQPRSCWTVRTSCRPTSHVSLLLGQECLTWG